MEVSNGEQGMKAMMTSMMAMMREVKRDVKNVGDKVDQSLQVAKADRSMIDGMWINSEGDVCTVENSTCIFDVAEFSIETMPGYFLMNGWKASYEQITAGKVRWAMGDEVVEWTVHRSKPDKPDRDKNSGSSTTGASSSSTSTATLLGQL